MTNFKINAAIQLLPIEARSKRWEIIDKAIALINASGLNHKVTPFETVVEGPMDKVLKLISDIKESTLCDNCPEIIINIKIHAATRDLSFSEKLEKY